MSNLVGLDLIELKAHQDCDVEKWLDYFRLEARLGILHAYIDKTNLSTYLRELNQKM